MNEQLIYTIAIALCSVAQIICTLMGKTDKAAKLEKQKAKLQAKENKLAEKLVKVNEKRNNVNE